MKKLILISVFLLSAFINIFPAASKGKIFFDWVACVENTLKGRKPLTFKEKNEIMRYTAQIIRGCVEKRRFPMPRTRGTIMRITRDDIVIYLLNDCDC